MQFAYSRNDTSNCWLLHTKTRAKARLFLELKKLVFESRVTGVRSDPPRSGVCMKQFDWKRRARAHPHVVRAFRPPRAFESPAGWRSNCALAQLNRAALVANRKRLGARLFPFVCERGPPLIVEELCVILERRRPQRFEPRVSMSRLAEPSFRVDYTRQLVALKMMQKMLARYTREIKSLQSAYAFVNQRFRFVK